MEKVSKECQKKYEQLKQTQSAEIAAEVRQIRANIDKKQEIWESDLIGLMGNIETGNKKLVEMSAGLKKLVEENKGKIEGNENRIAQVEKELVENRRRQWEKHTEIEQQRKNDQSKMTAELNSVGKEVLSLKQELRTQRELRETGNPPPIQQIAKEIPRSETVPTPLEEATPSGKCKGIQGLGSSEFPLPTFDENTGINPVTYLRQLEEFFKFRGVQQKHWLAVAKRSVIGSMSKQWVEATSAKFQNYEHFRKEFLATWWSAAQQGIIKCSLYQSKYDPSAGLSLSAHFLKYVTMASCLEPTLSDYEVIEAVRCHYPAEIQKLLVTTKMNTVTEALEVLKRLEMLEERMVNSRAEIKQDPTTHHNFSNRNRNEGQRGAGPVRQVQRYNDRDRRSWEDTRGRERYRGRNYGRGRSEEREQPPEEQRNNGPLERERSPRGRQPEPRREN
jgi:hypothetical protein